MIKKLLFINVLLFCVKGYMQEPKLSVQPTSALPIQYTKLMDNLDNVYNHNATYNFYNNSKISLGFQMNASLFTPRNLVNIDDTRIYSLNPSFLAQFHLKSLPKIHPYMGVGYTAFFIEEGNNYQLEQSVDAVLGIMIDVTPKMYTKLEYGVTKMVHPSSHSKISDDSSFGSFRIGSGFRF